MSAALDDRTFESAVPLDADQQAANLQHFRDKGYDVEVEDDPNAPASTEEEQPSPAAQPAPPEPAPAAQPAPAAAPQAAPGAATPPVPEIEADPVAEAEWAATKNDGEKLGWRAKKTKRIKELESELDRTRAEDKGRIEELQRQIERLSASGPAAGQTATPAASEPSATSQPASATEPIAAKPFEKPKPPKPKFEDFQNEADPYLAYTAAVDDRNEKLIEWDNERRAHEEQQRVEIAQRQKQRDDAVLAERQKIVNRNVEAVEREIPDWRTVTDKVKWAPVINHVLHERLGVEGMKLAYELAKPENRQVFDEISATANQFHAGMPQSDLESLIHRVTLDLGTFRGTLKATANAQPAAAAPAVPAPAPVQTPPTPQPRREEAAPTPVRSRGALEDRLEDIPVEDSDARRAWKRARGLL